jgi:hypothetical protein
MWGMKVGAIYVMMERITEHFFILIGPMLVR